MKIIINALAISLALLATASSVVADPHTMPQIKASASLEKMKQLVGTWTGSGGDMGDGKMEVQYRLTSGGSAVIETLAPGTPHEMTSVYYDEGGKLAMTHYCMLGNHPMMKLTKESANELLLEAGAKDLADQPHMHTLALTFVNRDSIEQKWSMKEPGKEGHSSVFKLHRKS
jgi:hypothetical protein